MSLTLYRKYRPQTFKELVGQNHIKVTLQNELEADRVAHAYLFAGPRGIGKTTTARLLAKAVNCLNRQPKTSEPCNICESCKEIMENHSLDIIEIDAASHTGVDNVRENIISNSRFVPTRRKYKVFIIDEVHMLSISAFNALLKTLEEPPEHAIFILATTEVHKLPPTIISRCQRFDFKKVNTIDLVQRLNFIVSQEKRIVSNDVLEAVARQADGSIRDAESLLGQILSIGEQEITVEQAELVLPRSDFNLVLEFIEYLEFGQSSKAIDFINRITNEGADLQSFASDIIEVLRKVMLVKTDGQLNEYAIDLSQEQESRVEKLAQKIKMEELVAMINIFLTVRQNLKYAEISQFPFELAVVQISHLRPGKKNLETDNNGKTNFKIIEKEVLKSADIDKPKAKKSANHKSTPFSKSTINISLDLIREKWGEILLKIKQYNYTLFSFLRVNKPLAIKGDIIQIGVCYKFHQERINERKNREILEKVFEEILGQKMKIECTIVERKAGDLDYVKEDQAVQNLIENFGGRVVESE